MKVLPLYNVLVLPNSNIYFQTQAFRAIAGNNVYQGDTVTLLMMKQQQTREEITENSFYPIGVQGKIEEIAAEGYVIIKTEDRVNITEIAINEQHEIFVETTKREDIKDLNVNEARQKLMKIKADLKELLSRFRWGAVMEDYIDQYTSIEEAAAVLSSWITITNEERYHVLEMDSEKERFDALEKIIYEYAEVTRVTTDAQSAQQQDYQKLYKENALKKQIDYLQKQLDEMHPEQVSEVRKFELKIQESEMNEEARREAGKVLNRLKNDGDNSAESGMLYDYLDFVTGLSWKKEEPEQIDLSEAEKILDEDHFGMKKVKERIIQQIAVMNLKRKQSGSIIVFVGAPGTGKTSIGKSIAKALHRKYVRVSLGGVKDEADIRGHRRTYIGAMPGRIMDGISKAGVSNPVMVLDEIDKLSSSYNGDPASALLEVLDPEQNNTFTDHYMNVPYDLSDVLFICTANTLDTIPAPLLNRMEVIQFQGYTPLEKFQIAEKHLLPKALDAVGLKTKDIKVNDDAMETIISDYTREGGVRGLKKRLDTLCRIAAVKFVRENGVPEVEENQDDKSETLTDNMASLEKKSVEKVQSDVKDEINDDLTEEKHESSSDDGAQKPVEEKQTVSQGEPKIVVTKEELREYLDMHALTHNKVKDEARPGVVTGLAWTQVGGEILYIETLFNKGEGKLNVTGQLGDVMKESVQIALSVVKSRFPELASKFKENDLHIHVPDGSTPKDGPSAGITMTTALASLVTGRPVSPHIAMTGEISLEGTVNAIGGLPEKLMAAERAGVTKVFIPKDNVEDLRDVASEVKDKLEIIPVEYVEEVLKATGVMTEEDNK
ncbi:endopeptidase La [Oribacterium sp. WCC10]|uniref:endopeptidase La n=1 Tax=Oribacterium sp. WCC10 TaxID=1855343 RepID=UPI0008F314CC|nr:endopeptidase La [Oribacterium sp. WCC10]SFG15345.1 ATP-dependent Lon protease [Oribacterium sp. WCC10]